MAAILAVSVGCCRRPLLGDVPASICVQSVIIILGFRLETAQPFSIRLYDCSAFPFTVCFEIIIVLGICCFLKYIFCTLRKFRSPYLVKAQQPQEQRYPILSVSCVRTMVWLLVFRTETVEACDCTRGGGGGGGGLYGHRKGVCLHWTLTLGENVSRWTLYQTPAPVIISLQSHYCAASKPGTGADDVFVSKHCM